MKMKFKAYKSKMFSFLDFDRMWNRSQEVGMFPPSMTVVSENFKIFFWRFEKSHW